MRHENSNLYTSVVGRGARVPSRGAALQRLIHHAPRPDSPRKLQGRARSEDSRKPRMRLANGTRRHKRLQREGPRLPARQVFASQKDPRRIRRAERGRVAGDAPPLPEGVRALLEPLDPRDGRRCGLRGGADRGARKRGDHPGDAFASTRGEMDAGQAVDNLPRPLIRTKKRRRDRLMEVSASDPEWASGFEDECWWSREALPTLNAWSEEGKPPRLVQRSVAKDDP